MKGVAASHLENFTQCVEGSAMETPTELQITIQDDVTVIHLPPEIIDPLDVATAREQWQGYFEESSNHRRWS